MGPLILKDLILFHDDLHRLQGADAPESALRARRAELLGQSEVAPGYLRRLAAKRAEIDALPSALVDDADLGMALLAANARSDGSALALWHYTEAILVKDDSTDEARASARRIRDTFIPERREINFSYPDTAALAQERAPQVEARAADLDRFPVPGGTLRRWAQDLIDAGLTLKDLIARRHLLSTLDPDRSPLGQLRSEFSGLVSRFRAAIGDEIKEGLLPAEADTLIFGYLDRLAADRARLVAARSARKDADAPPT